MNNRNSYVQNDVLNNLVLFATLFVINLFLLYSGVVNIIGLITDEFESLFVQLPKIILYLLPSAYLMLYFKNLYYKRISKVGGIVFRIITTILLAFCLCLMIQNFKYFINNYFSSYFNPYSPLDLIFLIVILLFINIVIFVKALKMKKDNYSDSLNPGTFNVYTKRRLVYILIVGVFSSFYLGLFVLDLSLINDITRYPLEYVIFLGYILLPFINLIFYLMVNFTKKKSLIAYGIIGIIDILYLIIFVLSLNSLEGFIYGTANQALLLATYAISLPISYALVGLILCVSIISVIFNIKKFIKMNK